MSLFVLERQVRPAVAAADAIATIACFQRDCDGWKGPGSVAPNPATITDSIAFARTSITRTALAPTLIGMASDGELVLTWQYPGLLVDVSISGDGTYSLFADFDGREIMNEATPVASGLPVDILDAISAKHGGALAG